jgi:small-conductance mechanosensitive channel
LSDASVTTALHAFGVTFIGATPENARKLLLTAGFVVLVTLLLRLLRWTAIKLAPQQVAFWARQGLSILSAAVLVLGVLSIWFDDPNRLATAAGLFTAGIAFALQRVITAVAGYFVILRGSTFLVGDRIMMGGVRGDVMSLNFMQTTIMEMGLSSGEQGEKPSMWVHSRQFTGRLVSVSNAKIFEEPVYNYSKEFPYIWEEIAVPIRYGDDRARAEAILIEAASKHTADIAKLGAEEAKALQERYDLPALKVEPKVYWRLTSNWLEMTVRFFVRDHGTRERKDAMSREILEKFDAAGLRIASATYEIVRTPPLELVGGAGQDRPGRPLA